MEYLRSGSYFGDTHRSISVNGLVLTETVYTHDYVDWHYHEHPYLTYLIDGWLIENHKKGSHTCSHGDLLFHNWDERHYNIKPPGYARGMHLELGEAWLKMHQVSLDGLGGSIRCDHPGAKLAMQQLRYHSFVQDTALEIGIEEQVLQLLGILSLESQVQHRDIPVWVTHIEEFLHEHYCDPFSLTELGALVQCHPVHLSREFPKYFGCTLGRYIRKLKIEKSLHLLSNPELSIAGISFDCGFADQSHFGRCFREWMGCTPDAWRRQMAR